MVAASVFVLMLYSWFVLYLGPARPPPPLCFFPLPPPLLLLLLVSPPLPWSPHLLSLLASPRPFAKHVSSMSFVIVGCWETHIRGQETMPPTPRVTWQVSVPFTVRDEESRKWCGGLRVGRPGSVGGKK